MSEPGEILWRPGAAPDRPTAVGRFVEWLAAERGLGFESYDALWRWSIDELEAFWAAIWDFYGVRASTPYEQVLASREMPGARWFAGARLNYAEHALSGVQRLERTAVIARSQTRAEVRLTFAELREQVAAARTGLQRLGVTQGDRVVAYMPNIPETLVAFLSLIHI